MQIPVLIERIAGNGYRARGGEPLGLEAHGETREEALAKLRDQLQTRVHTGDIATVELTQPHPWMAFAGMFKDDPLFDDWQKAIADYRAEVDADPNYL
jgi:hypothetical protein